MIAWLKGVIHSRTFNSCIIDVQGIGYEVLMMQSDLGRLPANDQVVQVHTAAIYREDSATLYGFLSGQNKEAFIILNTASGVGPKMALSILDFHDANQLSLLIAQGNYQALMRAKGVGQKLAKRLVIDLKGKIICRAQPDLSMQSPDTIELAVEALSKLGFSEGKARDMLKGVEAQSVEEMIKQALQQA
ncbi:Holliday junction branch migration protein RuvA [Candidatus Comchoanobacter bicostacola]|uniref:Holliday junction branch migration complex subunit RuvA n=1 Tax=Candidatus Comchoanobacter bicostacola TaxID=2919598 RepID=A0ABY5DL91_9GAMM|nr:Holliday junction branch migration protein RuvA [Candidatus Comchoanobacter bicostacola]UTC24439.1 Holliday junction branch migration protein RuvA [Candidatus Comchoanobacter bicostacola]